MSSSVDSREKALNILKPLDTLINRIQNNKIDINNIVPETNNHLRKFVDDRIAVILFVSCRYGFTEIVELLIKNGLDISDHGGWIEWEEGESYGSLALYYASAYGHLDIVNLLISVGIEFTDSVYVGLNCAIFENYPEIVKALLENELVISEEDSSSIFIYALHNPNIVKILLDNGVDCTTNNNEVIYEAIMTGNVEMVKMLLDNGADFREYASDSIGDACDAGNVEMVKLLLENVTDISEIKVDMTQLCSEGHSDIVELLLKKGLKCTDDDCEPLSWAILNNHPRTVKLLLDHGLRSTNCDFELLAMTDSHTEILNMLKSYGVKVW